MEESRHRPTSQSGPASRRARPWVGPTVFVAAILIPVLILIFSNTESIEIHFAWAEWNAPLWIVLAITFAAGALVTRLLLWTWRAYSRRRRRGRGDGGGTGQTAADK